MTIHTNELKQIFNLICDEQPRQAMLLIQGLNQEDLEYSALGATEQWHLFDLAVQNNLLDVANAIVEKYAQLTNDVHRKPLSIDYNEYDNNTVRYYMNTLFFMDVSILTTYKFLVDQQKRIYVHQIHIEIKKLRILAVEKLLELTANSLMHNKLLHALLAYEDNSYQLGALNDVIVAVRRLLGAKSTPTSSFQKAVAVLSTVDKLDAACSTFDLQTHNKHASLSEFIEGTTDILNHHSNEILKQSQVFKDRLVRIGQAIMSTGVGYVVASFLGKPREFNEHKWSLFRNKTKSEPLLASRVNTLGELGDPTYKSVS
ncbi:MAG: hypothetical protein ACRCXC_09335 [Legionella sp.]